MKPDRWDRRVNVGKEAKTEKGANADIPERRVRKDLPDLPDLKDLRDRKVQPDRQAAHLELPDSKDLKDRKDR